MSGYYGGRGSRGGRGGRGNDSSGATRTVSKTSVFFSNIPLLVSEIDLRKHFENMGHVVGFQLMAPPGKEVRHGFVNYLDARTAQDAITRLNGFAFGEKIMKVELATGTPRRSEHKLNNHGAGRGGGSHTHSLLAGSNRGRGHGRGTGYSRSVDRTAGGSGEASMASIAAAAAAAAGLAVEDVINFPPDFVDPLFGKGGSQIAECLAGMPVAEAYEAVEQLRVLILEQKHEAREILERNPQLRLAVVVILQHAGRLPLGSLPQEAIGSHEVRVGALRPRPSNGDHEMEQQPMKEARHEERVQRNSPYADVRGGVPHSKSGEGRIATPAVNAVAPSLGEEKLSTEEAEEREGVLAVIEQLGQEELERILNLSEAEINSIADVEQRKQLSVLHKHVVQMSASL